MEVVQTFSETSRRNNFKLNKRKIISPGDWLIAVLHNDSLRLFAENSLAPLGEYLLALLLAAGFVLGDVRVVTRVNQAVGALQEPLLLSR